MLFNSQLFLNFFASVYLLYLILPFRAQNILLLAASYAFYGYWDVRFLLLIIVSTLIDYSSSLVIAHAHKTERPRLAKGFLTLSILSNLSILGFFKYFNFFVGSFAGLYSSLFGAAPSLPTLEIILPVGISFYTFQTLSYTIDVYRKDFEPTRNVFDFALYVAFFPQLMAGPIERARKLIPQLQQPRSLKTDDFYDGLWLIIWGLFKKVFIADNIALFTYWWAHVSQDSNGITGYLFIIAFPIQVYCDFSGYSDMAVGLAKLLGINLTTNFRLPYFATNPNQLWQRWHITLGHWLRDYLYRPLRYKMPFYPKTSALFLTMMLAGLWHGAAWTFVLWGTGWGIIMLVHRDLSAWLSKNWRRSSAKPTQLQLFLSVSVVFHLWALSTYLFIAENLPHAWRLLQRSLLTSNYSFNSQNLQDGLTLAFFTSPLLFMQLAQLMSKDLMVIRRLVWYWQALISCILLTLLFTIGANLGKDFIYFQF